MTIAELRTALRELTELYFTGATVTFAKQSFVAKPVKPLVTLSTGSVTRPLNPPTQIVDGRPVAFYPATIAIQIDLFTHGAQTEVAPGFTPIVENTAVDDMLGFAGFLNSDYAVQWCHARDIAIVVPNAVEDLSDLINDTNYEFRAMVQATVYFTMTAIGYTATLAPESIKPTGSSGSTGGGGSIGPGSGSGGSGSGDTTGPGDTGDTEPGGSSGGSTSGGDMTYEVLTPVINISPSGGGNENFADDEVGFFSNVEINDKLVKEETET